MPALQNKTSKDPWQIAPPSIKKKENHKSRKKEQYACRYPRLQDIAPTPPVSKAGGYCNNRRKNNQNDETGHRQCNSSFGHLSN